MFSILVILFMLFTVGYAVFALAVIYHFKEYTIPHHSGPALITGIFAVFSGVAWIYGLFSLLSLRLVL